MPYGDLFVILLVPAGQQGTRSQPVIGSATTACSSPLRRPARLVLAESDQRDDTGCAAKEGAQGVRRHLIQPALDAHQATPLVTEWPGVLRLE